MDAQTSFRAVGQTDSDANLTATIDAVLSDIAIAVSNVSGAESAFAAADFGTAEALHLRAEQHLIAILEEIFDLTDAGAVAVEPFFTECEERLIRLRSGLLE